MTSIAQVQDQKEHDILNKYQSTEQPQDGSQLQHQESAAARVLQRTYRGHRERRQLRGLGLDPSTRWTEVRIGPTLYLVSLFFFSSKSMTLTISSIGGKRSPIPRPHHPAPPILPNSNQRRQQRPQPHNIRSPSKMVPRLHHRSPSRRRRRILPLILALGKRRLESLPRAQRCPSSEAPRGKTRSGPEREADGSLVFPGDGGCEASVRQQLKEIPPGVERGADE